MKKRDRRFVLVVGTLIATLLAIVGAIAWYQQRLLEGFAIGEVARREAALVADLERFRDNFDRTIVGWQQSLANAYAGLLRNAPYPTWSTIDGIERDLIDGVRVGSRRWNGASLGGRTYRAYLVWPKVLPRGQFRVRQAGVAPGPSRRNLILEMTMEVHDYVDDVLPLAAEETLAVELDHSRFVAWFEAELAKYLEWPREQIDYALWREWDAVRPPGVKGITLVSETEMVMNEARVGLYAWASDTHFDARTELLQYALPTDRTREPVLVETVENRGMSSEVYSHAEVSTEPTDARWKPSWHLGIWHARGSLADAVAAEQRRMRALTVAGLLLAGLAGLVLMIVALRSRQLGRMQADFASSISHELRSPLAVIHSAAVNLSDGTVAVSPRAHEYGHLIRSESSRLHTLVDRVLTLARLQSDDQALMAVDLSEVAANVLELLAPSIEAKGIDTKVSLSVPFAVRADAVALEAAVQNLIDNGIKHGGEGGRLEIEVNQRRWRWRDWVVLRIRDWGAGIERHERRKIFEPFYRGRIARERQTPGTGIGLDLAQRVARAFGGRIVAEPQAKGLAMHLWLPVTEMPNEV